MGGPWRVYLCHRSGKQNLLFLCDEPDEALHSYVHTYLKEEIQAEYGRISTASTGAILRKIIQIEQQGGDLFFGEKSFDVEDLSRIDENGRGIISVLRLTDIQDKPKLFSTFMLQLLAEVYEIFPEQGDSGRPELIIFIDEAHLVFEEASKALLNQIESIVKLIRSKGIGLYFVTQNPKDVPEDILAQLGLKIQHALRAFTAKDRKAIKLAAENYPSSDYYDTKEVLTQLGIGEAFVSVLNEKGIPFIEIDVEDNNISREELAKYGVSKTVPQIFVDGVPIGGSDALKAIFSVEI